MKILYKECTLILHDKISGSLIDYDFITIKGRGLMILITVKQCTFGLQCICQPITNNKTRL